jgi:hypothetical protein
MRRSGAGTTTAAAIFSLRSTPIRPGCEPVLAPGARIPSMSRQALARETCHPIKMGRPSLYFGITGVQLSVSDTPGRCAPSARNFMGTTDATSFTACPQDIGGHLAHLLQVEAAAQRNTRRFRNCSYEASLT